LHLWLWQQTAEPQHREHAVAAGEHLLSVAECEADMARWQIPAGYPGLSGRRLTGYAHGAAGIADVALDLYEITGQTPLLDAALGVCRWLSRTAHAAPEAGMNWPPDEGGRATMAFWCHGGAGIARFLLHLWQLTGHAEALEQARAAAPAVGRGTRWAGVTQCHGLSGNVECLLDLHQATGDEEHLANARSLARLVQAFAVRRDGQLTIVTDVERSDPGFSVGSAGVAACLLRLADPHVRPHLLSLRGFARRERASVLA